MKTKFTVIIAALLLSTSCVDTIKDKGTTIGNTFIDCEKADIGRTIPEVGLTILAVVTQILMAGEGNYEAKLDEIGAKYGNDTEACAVLAINTVLTGGNTGSASHTALSPAAARALSMIKSKGWKFEAN